MLIAGKEPYAYACICLSHGPKEVREGQVGCLWSEMTKQDKASRKQSIVAAWIEWGQ